MATTLPESLGEMAMGTQHAPAADPPPSVQQPRTGGGLGKTAACARVLQGLPPHVATALRMLGTVVFAARHVRPASSQVQLFPGPGPAPSALQQRARHAQRAQQAQQGYGATGPKGAAGSSRAGRAGMAAQGQQARAGAVGGSGTGVDAEGAGRAQPGPEGGHQLPHWPIAVPAEGLGLFCELLAAWPESTPPSAPPPPPLPLHSCARPTVAPVDRWLFAPGLLSPEGVLQLPARGGEPEPGAHQARAHQAAGARPSGVGPSQVQRPVTSGGQFAPAPAPASAPSPWATGQLRLSSLLPGAPTQRPGCGPVLPTSPGSLAPGSPLATAAPSAGGAPSTSIAPSAARAPFAAIQRAGTGGAARSPGGAPGRGAGHADEQPLSQPYQLEGMEGGGWLGSQQSVQQGSPWSRQQQQAPHATPGLGTAGAGSGAARSAGGAGAARAGAGTGAARAGISQGHPTQPPPTRSQLLFSGAAGTVSAQPTPAPAMQPLKGSQAGSQLLSTQLPLGSQPLQRLQTGAQLAGSQTEPRPSTQAAAVAAQQRALRLLGKRRLSHSEGF